MIKIVIIINNLGIGGAERLVIDDINQMIKEGISVKLITLKPEKINSLQKECLINRKNWLVFPFSSLYDFKNWFWLIKELKRLNPDIVITHLWFANFIGRMSCFLSGVSNVISFEHNVYDGLKTRKQFFIDWFIQSISTKIIAVSEAVKESLVKHGIKVGRIEVLVNGIDINRFTSISKVTNIRQELNIHNDTFIFLFIGRLIHQKAVDILLKSFSKVKKGYLVIVGEGKDRAKLEQMTKENGLENKVRFLGTRDDIPSLLVSSDCFVLPSRYEGLGIVVLEAMAVGKPIIISNFSASVGIIKNEENGLVVPIEDIESLTNAMNRVSSDDELRRHLSLNAQKDSENFSIKNHVKKIISLSMNI